MTETLEQQIRSFIVERFLHGRSDVRISPEALLVDEGIVDSTGVLELIQFLEERWGIEVGDMDAVPDNLGTIARIAKFVEHKRG